jgi:hypothetical protein
MLFWIICVVFAFVFAFAFGILSHYWCASHWFTGLLTRRHLSRVFRKLFDHGLLSPNAILVGYARSSLTHKELVDRIRPYIKVPKEKEANLEKFFEKCLYFTGSYVDPVWCLSLSLSLSLFFLATVCLRQRSRTHARTHAHTHTHTH